MTATVIVFARYVEFSEIIGSKKWKEPYQQIQYGFIVFRSENYNNRVLFRFIR